MEKQVMSGALFIAAVLKENGVRQIFSCPGAHVDLLLEACRVQGLPLCEAVSEQGALHAADGYARTTGELGVAIVGSGAGAAGTITGLATAMLDSVPLLLLVGQVANDCLAGDCLASVDISNMSMPITKHNFLVKNGAYLTEVIPFALKLAQSGRPGPILVDLPQDVQSSIVLPESFGKKASPETASLGRQTAAALDEAVSIIQNCKRPLLLAGGGATAKGAMLSVRRLAETKGIPVATTLMGIGVMAPENEYCLGFSGMHGSLLANRAVCEADVLIVVGSRFSDRVTGDRFRYGEGKHVIHLDVDPAEVDKNVFAHVAVVGGIEQSLLHLQECLVPGKWKEWQTELALWRSEYQEKYDGERLNAPWIMQRIGTLTKGQECTFVTDVGQNQMWAAQHLQIESPRQWVTSGGLGTMGFGLPAAMGAQAARRDRRVVHIAGDGGFRMTCSELYSLQRQKLPVLSLVIDNSCLGMVRQWQQLFYRERYSASLAPLAPDWECLTAAYGVRAQVVETPEEFEAAWQEAWQAKEPRVIVARIPTSDLVTPMLAPNSPLDTYVEVE
ncbi:thiamine pyrophosphate-binding protein [Azotosporobacter soli]|uniref:thiamine pyrophosphate-binding protein n=1 Tax=Azotosporobacter soli TaxID=3055040 RepID=UPI0031FE7505